MLDHTLAGSKGRLTSQWTLLNMT